MNLIHGCTQCHYPGCTRHSCPICHPEEHRHHDYFKNERTRNCGGYSFDLNVSHDWQDVGEFFVCRRCGKQIKKITQNKEQLEVKE